MNIGYRRLCGPIGITDNETGRRGLWLEKRLGLVRFLRNHGNTVQYLNRPTRVSSKTNTGEFDADLPNILNAGTSNFDVLLIEFGAHHLLHNAQDVAQTFHLIRNHTGKVIFVCDDPDLLFPFEFSPSDLRYLQTAYEELYEDVLPTLALDDATNRRRRIDLDYSQWTMWLNTPVPAVELYAAKRGTYFKSVPSGMRIFDMPFASLLLSSMQTPNLEHDNQAVYIGRTGGDRRYTLTAISENIPEFRPYGNPKEWANIPLKFPVEEPPTQSERAAWYHQRLVSICVADYKHIVLGWRTGRAYHALLAGCPTLLQKHHHWPGLPRFESVGELASHVQYMQNAPLHRTALWRVGIDQMRLDADVLSSTYQQTFA